VQVTPSAGDRRWTALQRTRTDGRTADRGRVEKSVTGEPQRRSGSCRGNHL